MYGALPAVNIQANASSMLRGVQVADNLRLKNVKLQQLVQEEDYQAVYSWICSSDDSTPNKIFKNGVSG